ncbi:MAG: class I SAM-dependent methyltransferase [Desulfobacterales bacterium]|nr:class I SAM-dependent methyltransferase [Desulfobacterales bacterium]MDJ0888564.1 class I SAM-dependent methyltransferase [Desulfobacterales bacterium]MDJ0989619.1 class I SAM-dependent methyltransferase [Desulfobacterales bacterium]
MITADLGRAGLRSGHHVLDIGCGNGRHTAAAYGHDRVTAVGADRNRDDLIAARDRLEFHDRLGAHGGGNWRLTAADALALPFHSQSFDIIICSEVLEHIPDHRRAAREIVRVLKPGGTLVVSVPRWYPERICWALSHEYHQANQGHVRIYRTGPLKRMIETAGVVCFHRHWAHSLHAPYWWLKCLLGPNRTDSPAVNLYHRFLTWDIMQQPRLTRRLERLLNPILGKSIVLYFRKPA